MSVLWRESPLTVGQIIERAQDGSDWHPNTIKTLLSRLTEKGAVSRKKDGKRFFYVPAVKRSEIVTSESVQFLNQFFDGKMAPLVAHFADQKKLTKQDIEEIEQIINSIKRSK